MTKRKTKKYKKKAQKVQKKQYKPMPKYKIVTTTDPYYPLLRKTVNATTLKSAVFKAKRNAITFIKQTNMRTGKYVTKTYSQIYYYSPRVHKYKKLINHRYKGMSYVKEIWGKDYYKVKRV